MYIKIKEYRYTKPGRVVIPEFFPTGYFIGIGLETALAKI